MSLVQRAKQEMLDEFYKLDYEDTIGDLKTRFKYAKIKPNRYGLKTADILMLDDKELNQYVSMKKLVPYCDKEWKGPRHKVFQEKQKIWGLYDEHRRTGKKKRRINDPERSTSEMEGKEGDKDTQAKDSKRKRKRKALKITGARKSAYGMNPKPKKNRKKI